MRSTSESSFRARTGRAEEFLTYISGFENYAPTRPEDRLEGMTQFVSQLKAANTIVANTETLKQMAIGTRYKAFYHEEDSVQKLVVQIKAAVDSQYGKRSSHAIVINRIIRNMRSIKHKITEEEITEETHTKSHNKSERSFGTVTEIFRELAVTIENIADYETSNPRVTSEALKNTVKKLALLNSEVNTRKFESDVARTHRSALFDELKIKTQRIKSYVKGQYGMHSTEYQLIKGMSFAD
jgi:hypothetical protein